MPTFSIIICTYNRDKYIYNVLKSIAENDFPTEKFEIILINNNSTDNTEEECNRFRTDFPLPNYRYFIEKEQGLSYARNRGINKSTGDILIYVDDDALVVGEAKKVENIRSGHPLRPELVEAERASLREVFNKLPLMAGVDHA